MMKMSPKPRKTFSNLQITPKGKYTHMIFCSLQLLVAKNNTIFHPQIPNKPDHMAPAAQRLAKVQDDLNIAAGRTNKSRKLQ